ncbi:MAG: metal-sensing transcriptional repressor [Ottowia sp.]|uniref:metal-sensing transcriptional repressor n=1 Tax=Ottowia sp. TaxID=1898956 RepID=UPI001D1D90B0|nr:metal-sensing transcriptional repressor [Ottowia sp.]MCP5259549.1 metal-sensing transcriptional repressor [Burkholderiaceae bacterium]MCB2023927.1 metal-sensing transcriptional repressor [Ottowia sp.]MCB2037774.1 metal-sensing transcriptional repressor [Ottowia sp.]MCB2070101.1 metal-sensing transcriptional repressor [Ottowia sp.]HPK30960.1 metal-sensing transcriptional repressor [Ottowia sp.]
MPHSPEDKKRAIARLRRIRGQAEALERSVAEGAACGALLQQLAALRGAVNGLMAEVLEGHLRESFGHADCDLAGVLEPEHARIHAALDDAAALVRSYLR